MYGLDMKYFYEYLVELNGKFNQDQWYGYLRKDLPRAYILFEKKSKVGYFRYSIIRKNKEPTILLRVIAIHPNWRGKGYGKALYEYFENLVKKQNFKQIELNCPLKLESISWYPKLGYILKNKDKLAGSFQKNLKFIEGQPVAGGDEIR
jgi:N-acetylglutamate synthase-like GNAT family acetyltransferase